MAERTWTRILIAVLAADLVYSLYRMFRPIRLEVPSND